MQVTNVTHQPFQPFWEPEYLQIPNTLWEWQNQRVISAEGISFLISDGLLKAGDLPSIDIQAYGALKKDSNMNHLVSNYVLTAALEAEKMLNLAGGADVNRSKKYIIKLNPKQEVNFVWHWIVHNKSRHTILEALDPVRSFWEEFTHIGKTRGRFDNDILCETFKALNLQIINTEIARINHGDDPAATKLMTTLKLLFMQAKPSLAVGDKLRVIDSAYQKVCDSLGDREKLLAFEQVVNGKLKDGEYDPMDKIGAMAALFKFHQSLSIWEGEKNKCPLEKSSRLYTEILAIFENHGLSKVEHVSQDWLLALVEPVPLSAVRLKAIANLSFVNPAICVRAAKMGPAEEQRFLNKLPHIEKELESFQRIAFYHYRICKAQKHS